MATTIKDVFYVVNRYAREHTSRSDAMSDVYAYTALVNILENPDNFGLAVVPNTTAKTVWEMIVETGYEFDRSDDFNAHIIGYLTDPYHPYAHKVMDVQVIKADVNFDGNESESVSFGVIPDGWDNYLEEHPLDDSIFYWLKPEEVENFGKGSRPAPEWTVLETY